MEEDETKPTLLNSNKTPTERGENTYTNYTNSHKNGLTSIELLMSMTGDLNRNLPVSGLADTSRPSADGGQDMNCIRGLNTERNHHAASQLLKAAASVVSNGIHSLYRHDSHLGLPTSSVSEVREKPAITNISTLNNSTTVVSYSSKPTMSTGFPSTALMQPKFSDPRVFESSRSSVTEFPRASQPAYNVSSVIQNSTLTGLPKSVKSSVIVVPMLWRRILKDEVISYYSPSGEELTSLEDTKKYLLSEETCKCGLVCPFHVEKVFNFDPTVDSQDWKLSDLGVNSETSVRLCCHRKHIRSTALAKDCKTLPKPSKPSPARRRAKPTQKSGIRKSTAMISHKENKHKYSRLEGGEVENLRAQVTVTSSSSNTTPIPPIETVMRSSLYVSHNEHTGLQSPRQLSENVSPSMSMLSVHSATNQSGHMLPGMGPSSYPSPHTGTFVPPMYRPTVEAEMMSPGNHPIYLPGMQGLPPPPHPPMPPYHNPGGYEYMQNQHRQWNSPLPPMHTMPPPGVQFGPPAVWHARPDANNSRKRRRRASSISSNGGNSDTGYTSGLSSPAHTSPGQSKLHDKTESTLAKSKNADDRKNISAESSALVKEPNGISSRQSRISETKNTSQPAGSQETTATRHTSVIRSPEMRVPHSHNAAHIPGPPYAPPPNQRQPKHSTSTSYQQPHQPLPPIQLSERTPASAYGQPHSRAQVIRGVYSRPSNDSRPSDLAHGSTEDESSGVNSHVLTKSNTSTADTVTNSESEPQDLTMSNGVGARRMSESALLSQHTGLIPQSTHFVPPPMYMNGFQPNPHMVPPMHYPSPGMPDEYPYSARPPVQMMRAPNGQIFYRYAQPRMPMAPQAMPYAVDNPMYPQMPFMAGQGPPYGYHPPANQPASPKRKRKKTGTKTIIESHSAVLARTDNGPDGTEAGGSAEHDGAAS